MVRIIQKIVLLLIVPFGLAALVPGVLGFDFAYGDGGAELPG